MEVEETLITSQGETFEGFPQKVKMAITQGIFR